MNPSTESSVLSVFVKRAGRRQIAARLCFPVTPPFPTPIGVPDDH